MKDYKAIQNHCQTISVVSEALIDKFLLNFISDREGLEKKFTLQLVKYKSIIGKMPEGWLEWVLGQYLGHCIFKKGGLAGKYAGFAEVKGRTGAERELFNHYLKHPWRFTSCSIIKRPSRFFFLMGDFFTGEEFLLYSPSIEGLVKQYPNIQSFFLLIDYSGMCWQTFSLVTYFKGFQSFDFFYFAKQINPNIDFPSDAQSVMEKNPTPFMFLYAGAEYPLTLAGDEIMAHCYSEFHMDDFDPEPYSDDFLIDMKTSIYRLRLKGESGYPHFALCYFNKKKNRLVMTSMTRYGYDQLTSALNKTGYDFPNEPDVMATASMLTAAKQIFKRDFNVDPYGNIFKEKVPPESKKEMEKINLFLNYLMKALNSGERQPDIASMAAKAGVSREDANEVARQVLKTFDNM